jgi:hypothetical protein
MEEKNYKYNAFISYLQVPDKPIAIAIRKGLMELGAKKYLLKFRALEIFRDETDMAGKGSLTQRIQFGIDNSEYLILLARPAIVGQSTSEKKNWVQEEIEYWLRSKYLKDWPIKKRIEDTKIIICVLEGEIRWGSEDFINDKKNCLNEILKGIFSGEPKWIDLRKLSEKIEGKSENEINGFLSLRDPEFLQKVAEISGQIQNKSVDELIAEDRKRQLLWSNLLITSLIFMVILSGVAYHQYANAKANELAAKLNLKNYRYKTVEELIDNARAFNMTNDSAGRFFKKLSLDSAKKIISLYDNDTTFKRESVIIAELEKQE